MTTSPTQLSLKHLRSLGYVAAVVERWNPHAKIRQDLFGCIDLLALDEAGRSIWVQTTTASHMAARRKKLRANDILPLLGMQGKVLLHGWHKVNNRWQLKEERVTA